VVFSQNSIELMEMQVTVLQHFIFQLLRNTFSSSHFFRSSRFQVPKMPSIGLEPLSSGDVTRNSPIFLKLFEEISHQLEAVSGSLEISPVQIPIFCEAEPSDLRIVRCIFEFIPSSG
jgi:hypothetical protein